MMNKRMRVIGCLPTRVSFLVAKDDDDAATDDDGSESSNYGLLLVNFNLLS
jgi:hypothetical protein